jgi:hypothetical protein
MGLIDISKPSLKAVFLHDGNECPLVPVAHAIHIKESYDNMHLHAKCIHMINICGISV